MISLHIHNALASGSPHLERLLSDVLEPVGCDVCTEDYDAYWQRRRNAQRLSRAEERRAQELEELIQRHLPKLIVTHVPTFSDFAAAPGGMGVRLDPVELQQRWDDAAQLERQERAITAKHRLEAEAAQLFGLLDYHSRQKAKLRDG